MAQVNVGVILFHKVLSTKPFSCNAKYYNKERLGMGLKSSFRVAFTNAIALFHRLTCAAPLFHSKDDYLK